MVCLWNQGSSDVLKFPEKGAGCVGAEIDAVKVSFCAGLPVPSPTHTHSHTHSQLTDARTLTDIHTLADTQSHTLSHTYTHTQCESKTMLPLHLFCIPVPPEAAVRLLSVSPPAYAFSLFKSSTGGCPG